MTDQTDNPPDRRFLGRIGLAARLELCGIQLDPAEKAAMEARRHRSRRGRIGLARRLAMCDFAVPMTAEEREWLDAPAVGRELI